MIFLDEYYLIIFELVMLYIIFLKNSKLKKYLILILIIFYSFNIGYRNINIGIDTKAYIKEYLTGTGGYFSEIGYTYTSKVLYSLGVSYQNFFFLLTLITLYMYLYRFYLFNQKKYFLIYWCFLFNVTALYGSVNGIRQFIAGSFFLVSLGKLNNRKNKLAIIYFLLGCLFHKSLVIYIFIYFLKLFKRLKKIKLNKKILILISLISFGKILEIILEKSGIFNFYKEFFQSNSYYIKYSFVICIFYIYSNLKLKNKRVEYIFFCILMIISLFFNYNHISNRYLYYLNILTPLLFYEYLIKKMRNQGVIVYIMIVLIYHIAIIYYPATQKMFFKL